MISFKKFLKEGRGFKFSQDQYNSINRMYVAGTDDEKIIEWISKNIKSAREAYDIFQEFIRQKSGK